MASPFNQAPRTPAAQPSVSIISCKTCFVEFDANLHFDIEVIHTLNVTELILGLHFGPA